MAIGLIVLTVVAAAVAGLGFRRLRELRGGGLSRSAILVFGGVAALAMGLAFTPFALAGELSDGLTAGIVAAMALVLAGTAGLGFAARGNA